MNQAKPFPITKRQAWGAYKRVKANQGGAGVDGQTLKEFERCWRKDWVVDLDIKGFFDTIDHALLLRAVRHHTQERWVLLYIKRWLEAPVWMPDGTLQERTKGTPQGGVISPLLAKLFLHYTFDAWMQRHYPYIPFERYADDAVCHCRTRSQAEHLKLVLWATRKYKHLRNHRRRASHWLERIVRRQTGLFAHWRLLYGQAG